MKIAVVSDTHNQAERTQETLRHARRLGAELVLHCGDIEEPPIVELFRGWDAHFVLGNCDWSPAALGKAINDIGATLHHRFGHIDAGGAAIAFTHGHDRDLLEDLVRSGAYDYLFHGHTHVAAERVAGPTRVVNPGALHRATVKSFVVLDTSTRLARHIEVE